MHKEISKRIDTNQSWLPKDWDIKDIFEAGKYASRHERKATDGIQVYTRYKGVNE